MPRPSSYPGMPDRDDERTGTETQAIVDAAREVRLVEPHLLDPVKDDVVLVRGDDGDVHVLDVDRFRAAPRRPTGTHHPADVSSLVDLVQELGDGEHQSTIWVHPTSGRVEAILDDHHSDGPGHGEHRAVLQLEATPEWRRWTSLNGKLVSQEQFAEHLEDSIEDVQDPPAADLLEIVKTLQGNTEVDWRKAIRLDDGTVQLLYSETATAKAGQNGDLHVPQRLRLTLAPFYGEDRRDVTARFRWRLRDGNLVVGYVLDRHEVIVQDALNQVRDRLRQTFPRTYVGTPR